MSASEYNAISHMLRAHKTEVTVSDVWRRINGTTSLGSLVGKKLFFTRDELEGLRRYGRSITGLDPLLEDLGGNRIEVAEKTSNEKHSGEAVFGRMVSVVTKGRSVLPLRGECQDASAPANVVLSVAVADIDHDRLKAQKIVISENGSTITAGHLLTLPREWSDALVIYRGNGRDKRHVSSIVASQPSENIAFLHDFDPAGLSEAAGKGKGVVIIPSPEYLHSLDEQSLSNVNQPAVFNRQAALFKTLSTRVSGDAWQSILALMKAKRVAIMEEHMIAHALPLIVGPVISPVRVSA